MTIPPFLAGGGEMGARIRAQDWAATPLGVPSAWPAGLQAAVRQMLCSSHPMFIWYGPALTQMYNDAYLPSLVPDRHPGALGQAGQNCWPEIWPVIGPQIVHVMAAQGSVWHENQPLPILREGRIQETFWTYSFDPIDDPSVPSGVGGVLVICRETTAVVFAERRRLFQVLLDGTLRTLAGPREVVAMATRVLGKHLEAGRVSYVEIGAAGEQAMLAPEWRGPGSAGMAGAAHLDGDGPPYAAKLRAGLTIRVGDAAAPGLAPGLASGLVPGSSVAAFMNAPLVKEGRLAAVLSVTCAQPRQWTDDEALLAEDVADCIWTTVERARAEQSLRHSENDNRLLAAVVEQSTDFIGIVADDGATVFVNVAGRRMVGLGAGDPTGLRKVAAQFAAPGHGLNLPDALSAAPDGSWRGELLLPHHTEAAAVPVDCTVFEVNDGAGATYAYAIVGRDLTERKQAEDALRRMNETLEQQVVHRTAQLQASEAQLRTIFETGYQLKAILAPDGTVLDLNTTALTAIDGRLPDLAGQPIWDTPWFTATPRAPEQFRAMVEAAADGKRAQQEMALQVNAGWRLYDVSVRPVRDRNGAVSAIVCESIDITERRQVEEALRQSQKMEAVGQLTGGLAHDFNNLLTGISGSLELLQSRLAQGRTAGLDRYIDAAQVAARRAAALTHRLLAFSRRQTLDARPTDLNLLLGSMAELVRHTVGPTVAVAVTGTARLWTVSVDQNQVENALLNLCINARDAMPDGGRLTIETANVMLAEQAAQSCELPPGRYVVLSVADTGLGMSPEVIARAFDPFFTTKPLGQGTGLGLSMIYGFARQSGGQVRIESDVGRGTTVRLYLPRHAGPAASADMPSAGQALPAVAGQGETVLVVDDEPSIRMLAKSVLEDMGCQSIEAADAGAALRLLESNMRIDVLVTDVGLPNGMNGRQLADAARSLRPALQVLFITGYAENAMLGTGMLDPGMHVLTKPFAMTVLAQRVKTLLDSAATPSRAVDEAALTAL